MNEITNIHLGRQPFKVAVNAHKELQEYLDAIKKQVGKQSKDVLEEVELRMAELLHERGLGDRKVIMLDDVDFLKRQLGDPRDFKEEAETTSTYEAPDDPSAPKRLYRDTNNAMLAGVSSGLAAYFGIDVVIIRILFVIAVISGGWGILVYLLLWILVPEAKTPSERLQMQGKAVTVESIKEIVDRADLKGAAERATTTANRIAKPIGRGIALLFGSVLAALGSAILLAELTFGTYLLLHGSQVNKQVILPVTTQEWFFIYTGLATLAILGLLFLLSGIASIRGKWSLPAWATAGLIALFFAGCGIGTATAFDAMPGIEERIDRAEQAGGGQCENFIFNYCSYDGHDYKIEFPAESR